MVYFVLFGIIAVWIGVDAYKRKNNFTLWFIGTVLIGPIIAPIYFAVRNLKEGEVREGGTGWNVLKNFALVWTLLMVFVGFSGMIGAGEALQETTGDAEALGATIGTGLGLLMIAMLWFFPMVGALVLGFFLKKTTKEEGPTGKLVDHNQTQHSSQYS